MTDVLIFAGLFIGGMIALIMLISPFVIFVDFMFSSRLRVEKYMRKVADKSVVFGRFEYMGFWLPVYGLNFCAAIYPDFHHQDRLELIMLGLCLPIVIASLNVFRKVRGVVGGFKVLVLITLFMIPMAAAQFFAFVLNSLSALCHSSRYMGNAKLVSSFPR